MLTAMPRHDSDETRALLEVAGWFRGVDWDRAFVTVVAVFHLWLSLTLSLAPDRQIVTQGSRPAFSLFPPHVWAWAFLVGGLAAVWLAWRVSGPRQVLAWILVAPAQTVWLGASVLAVAQGGGSAIGVVLWSVIVSFTALTAVRLAIAYTSGKR